MSGLSMATPRRANAQLAPPTIQSNAAQKQRQQTSTGGVMSSLRLIELQLVAFIMVFSVTGLVPIIDLIYPVFASVYLIALARFAFPASNTSVEAAERVFRGGGMFQAYVVAGTTFGLFLPLAYVLGGFARGDDHAVRSATPHLFLLACQLLTENLTSGFSFFSAPVRAMVPLLYTVRRILVDVDWVYDVWINKRLAANATVGDTVWMWFGRSLAVANCLYFSINLYAFLIPQLLPRAFEKYFKEGDEVYTKTMEDQRARAAADDEQRASRAAANEEQRNRAAIEHETRELKSNEDKKEE